MNRNDWYSVYTAALLEFNPTKRPTLIHDAETEIFSGSRAFPRTPIRTASERLLRTRCLICGLCKETCCVTPSGARLRICLRRRPSYNLQIPAIRLGLPGIGFRGYFAIGGLWCDSYGLNRFRGSDGERRLVDISVGRGGVEPSSV